MIPLTEAHEKLVALERARLLARLERTRTEREAVTTHRTQSRAGHRAGTISLRRLAGGMLVRAGKLIAGRELHDCPPVGSTQPVRRSSAGRPASATR